VGRELESGGSVLVLFPCLQPLSYLVVIHQVISRQPVRFANEHDAQSSTDSGFEGAAVQIHGGVGGQIERAAAIEPVGELQAALLQLYSAVVDESQAAVNAVRVRTLGSRLAARIVSGAPKEPGRVG
jgi:hypothetical protein